MSREGLGVPLASNTFEGQLGSYDIADGAYDA